MSADRSSPKRLPTRVIVIGVIILIHGILFYVVINQRPKPTTGDDRQAFTPVIRETGGSSGSLTQPRGPNCSPPVPADSSWRFDPIDVVPSEASEDTIATGKSVTGTLQDSARADSAPAECRITIKSWVQPEYPLAWARAGEEGSVSLGVHLDANGKPTEVKPLRATASARLAQSAQSAVSAWRFSMPATATARVEIELRFSRYRYGYSFVGEPLPDGAPDPGKQPVSSEDSFRNLLGGLSSSKPTFATLENSQPVYQKMRTTVTKWGRPVQLRLLKPKEHEWKEYSITPEFRGTTYGGTIALSWDLYEVRHEHVNAKWKVAADPYGRIWAVKADTY
jgi:TonB family protein